MKKILAAILFATMICSMSAQTLNNGFGSSATNANSNRFDRSGNPMDTTAVNDAQTIPIGLNSWQIDILGNQKAVPVDTLQTGFQNSDDTSGPNGHFSYLGNLASPRISHVFFERPDYSNAFFIDPYDYTMFLPLNTTFTNTKSPFVNLSYYKYGGSPNAEERFKAYYASNVNKRLGFGFNIDYVYGRGLYASQSTAQFHGNLFAYYLGDRYNMHFSFNNNDIKMAENGGLTDDTYVRNPLAVAQGRQTYKTNDMPTNLSQTWNENVNYSAFLTHRYNLGFERTHTELKEKKDAPQSLVEGADIPKDTIRTTEFVPVTSFIHTVQFNTNTRAYITKNNAGNQKYYRNNFFSKSQRDENKYMYIENTLALALREGFNKWAKAGLTAYARHEYKRYLFPDSIAETGEMTSFRNIQQNLVVGGELAKREGKTLHYVFTGELPVLGTDVGEFVLAGNADLNVKLFNDTVRLEANAYMKYQHLVTYFSTMRTKHFWWDANLDKMLRTRIEGKLTIDRWQTELRAGIENIKNYAYFTDVSKKGVNGNYLKDITVEQTNEHIQIISATLKQNFALGIFHLDNEVTYQKSTNETLIPLPQLVLYHNLYMKFGLAKKVLQVELGADMRYFTKYYAPDYSPAIGQFHLQNAETRYKVGDFPLVNAYVNLHLKRTRFFLSYYNALPGLSDNNYFMIPHYPLNPSGIKFGVSWNFFD